MSAELRKAVCADLERLRQINIEAKALRLRLSQLTDAKAALSIASIAHSHGVPIRAVQTLAAAMPWTEAEKPTTSQALPYDLGHAR